MPQQIVPPHTQFYLFCNYYLWCYKHKKAQIVVQCIDSLVMLSNVIFLIKCFCRLKFKLIFKTPHTVEGRMWLTCHMSWLHVKTCVLFPYFVHCRIWPNIVVSLSCSLNDVWAYRTNARAWQARDCISQCTQPNFATVFNHTRYATLQTPWLCPKILLLWTLVEIGKNIVCCQSNKHNAKNNFLLERCV
jgi:hypothetical protein